MQLNASGAGDEKHFPPTWFGAGHATAQRNEQRGEVAQEEPGCDCSGEELRYLEAVPLSRFIMLSTEILDLVQVSLVLHRVIPVPDLVLCGAPISFPS